MHQTQEIAVHRALMLLNASARCIRRFGHKGYITRTAVDKNAVEVMRVL